MYSSPQELEYQMQFNEQERNAKRLYDLLNLGADQFPQDPFQPPQVAMPQQQVSAIPSGMNQQNTSMTMREAFNPATYGFAPDSGASLRMPEGADPNQNIDRRDYFKPGGEYWGNTPQTTVASAGQGVRYGSKEEQSAEDYGRKKYEAEMRGQEYLPELPAGLPTKGMLPGEMRQLQTMMKPVYKQMTDSQGNVIGSSFDREGSLANQNKVFDIIRGLGDQDVKRRKANAEMLKSEADLLPKPTKVDETPEQKNYRFAMTLPEAMREPFLEKLGMSRKPEKDADAKRAAQMEGIGDVISQAKAILTNKAPAQVTAPTQSGLGSIADTAAGWFGMAPPGSEEADKLRVLGGVLTSKMPRMEGPQSEYDVKLYQEMAGRVGDSSVPVSRRVKALEQVQSLWKKYDKSGEGQVDAGATQQPSSQYVETRQTKAGLVGKKADGTLELIRR